MMTDYGLEFTCIRTFFPQFSKLGWEGWNMCISIRPKIILIYLYITAQFWYLPNRVDAIPPPSSMHAQVRNFENCFISIDFNWQHIYFCKRNFLELNKGLDCSDQVKSWSFHRWKSQLRAILVMHGGMKHTIWNLMQEYKIIIKNM